MLLKPIFMRQLICLLTLFLAYTSLFSQTTNPLLSTDLAAQQKWVDNLYNNMTLEEKVGQLFMVQAFSNQGLAHENIISQVITNYNIGGIIFSKGDPVNQARMNN